MTDDFESMKTLSKVLIAFRDETKQDKKKLIEVQKKVEAIVKETELKTEVQVVKKKKPILSDLSQIAKKKASKRNLSSFAVSKEATQSTATTALSTQKPGSALGSAKPPSIHRANSGTDKKNLTSVLRSNSYSRSNSGLKTSLTPQ